MTTKNLFLGRNLKQGFTLVELMTVVVIVGIMTTIAVPGYRLYKIQAISSEAGVTIGTISKNLHTYYLEHGRFAYASASPSIVPGAVALGQKETFTANAEWTELGNPISVGSAMNFSYAVAAGQTPAGGGPITSTNPRLITPTADLDLTRATAVTVMNNFGYPTSRTAREPFGIDWNDFNFNSFAQMGEEELPLGGGGGLGGGEELPVDDGGSLGGGLGGGGIVILPPNFEGGPPDEELPLDESGVGGGGMGDPGYTMSPQCMDFGVSTAVDFGVQHTGGSSPAPTSDLSAYNWAIISAVANLDSGESCTLMVKVMQGIEGMVTTSGTITITEASQVYEYIPDPI